jgi:hypothetical protein
LPITLNTEIVFPELELCVATGAPADEVLGEPPVVATAVVATAEVVAELGEDETTFEVSALLDDAASLGLLLSEALAPGEELGTGPENPPTGGPEGLTDDEVPSAADWYAAKV